MNQALQKLIRDRWLLLLVLLWIAVNAGIFMVKGIVTDFEAEKYISQARLVLKNGLPESDNYFLYSTTIYLIALSLKLRLGFGLVVCLQLIMNLISTLFFFRLCERLFKNSTLAFFATSVLLFNVFYQQYNTFLFTESLFYSLVVIYTSYLLLLKTFRLQQFIIITFLLLLLCVTRPTGILMLAATMIYAVFWLLRSMATYKKLLLILGSAIIFFFLLNNLLGLGGTLDFMLPFRNENIICGVDSNIRTDVYVPEKGNSLSGMFAYIVHNPAQVRKLAGLRSVAFFGMTRNYYSAIHNIYLVAFFYPLFVMAVVGSFRLVKKHKSAIIFLLSVVLFFWLTTMLTCDDWHNRFVLTLSPIFILLAFAAFIPLRQTPGYKKPPILGGFSKKVKC